MIKRSLSSFIFTFLNFFIYLCTYLFIIYLCTYLGERVPIQSPPLPKYHFYQNGGLPQFAENMLTLVDNIQE